MLYFNCHTEPVRLTEHLRGTRKSEGKKSCGHLMRDLLMLCWLRPSWTPSRSSQGCTDGPSGGLLTARFCWPAAKVELCVLGLRGAVPKESLLAVCPAPCVYEGAARAVRAVHRLH